VLLVLDDLHWAGKPTLLLLWHLLRADDGAALMIAGTYRDTEPSYNQALAQLLADLRRQQGVEYLTLAGLDQAGVDAFLEAAAGHSLDENGLALARILRVETDGNPFFVGEVLRHLVETGALAKRDGVWRVEGHVDQIGIPEGVRDVVNGRLSRLSEPAHRALTVGSVIGAEFTLDVVERVQNGDGSGGDALLDGLDEALRTRLILEPAGAPGQYAFAHALVRQTLYEGLTGTRRARMHWRVAEALEERHGSTDGPHLAALAHHFMEAAPLGPTAKAAEYALRASQWALDQVAYEQAVVVLERGLQALSRDPRPDESLRCELLLAVAQCRAQALDFGGMREASLQAAAAARAAGSAEGMARAAVWYNARPIAGARDDVGIRLCEEALAALGETQTGVRAVVLATMVLHLSFAGEGIAVQALSREALTLAEATDDPVAMAMASMARYYTIWGSPAAAEQLELAEALMSSPVITPSGFLASYDAHRLRAIAQMILGNRPGFEADLDEVERLGEELRSRYYLAVAAQWRATLALLDGRFDEVEELTSLQLTHAGEDQNFLNSFAAQILQLNLEQGRAAELKPMVVDVVERNPGIPGFRAALAVTLVELDEVDDARREFETLAPDRFAVMPRDLVWPATLTLLTEVCVALDDRERAETLLELFEPYTGLLVVTGGGSFCPGAVDRYLGMLTACLGRHEEAETFYRSALELEERVSSPPLVARTRYWYGRGLLERGSPGDREEAMALLALALETAESRGMKGLAARVRSAATPGPARA
jgi:tetratricopeptide (TPR) repeat protein